MWTFIKEHYLMRRQLLYLAKTDLVKTYRGAALGWLWSIIQPTIFLFMYWFVFHIGWRVKGGTSGVDFFTWLLAGIIAWYFMSDMLSAGTNCFKNYSYLVAKMRFPISTIPTFVAMSKFLVHLGLLVIVLIYLTLSGDANIYWLQLPFYMALMFGFFVVWSLFAAPLAAISKDFANLVRVATQILFWMSGILWSVSKLKIAGIHYILLFNPVSFIVEGYRQTLVGHKWFFEDRVQLACFLLVFGVMIWLAYLTFKRARKEIVDVL